MVKLKNLKGVANNIAASFDSHLPSMSYTKEVAFEVDLLTGKVIPPEVLTESLAKDIEDVRSLLFGSCERLGLKEEDVQKATLEIKGGAEGRYDITAKITVDGKEYIGFY